MKILVFVLLVLSSPAFAQNNDSIALRALSNNIMLHGTAYENLRFLCKNIGPRLSGSANAQKAVEATARMLKEAGADTVFLQPCMVPHWVRGDKEQAIIYNGKTTTSLHVCALGMSVGTPAAGIKAPVIEVKNFDELHALGEAGVKGKIVFFNYAMRPNLIFGGYGDAVRYRGAGPVEAAKLGAVAVMVRSVTHALDYNPHTGATNYDSAVTKIPALACSTMDAEWLSKALAAHNGTAPVMLFIKTNCRQLPDAPSFNVVGEIRGSEKPDEIITTGGHLDSWDLAEGAHDDGTGVIQSIEMLRAIKASGLRPRRTIRAVMFMNEENGLRGGLKYAELAVEKNEKHIFAMESDEGGFGCTDIGINGTPQQMAKMRQWLPLFKPYGILDMKEGGGGADIGPLKKTGTFMASVDPNSQRYFNHHHSPIDVFETVDKRELEIGAFALAGACWLVSEYGL